MTSRRQITAFVRRERAAEEEAAAATDEAGSTPYQKLLRAAESGQFEALVRQARPAKPLAMVTPQEREAALRTQPEPKQAPRPAPQPLPAAKTSPPDPTPNEQYLAEHCRWRGRGPRDDTHRRPPRECLTEYDPLAEEEETSC
jgi:hypothetical protein